MDQNILQKLQKLLIMSQRGTENEAENAKRLFEKLLDKYGIDENELEQKDKRELKFPYAMKDYVIHICTSLNLKTFYYTKRRKSPILVESTETEFNLVNDLIKQVKIIYEQKKKEAQISVDSYMCGFVSTTYPISDNKVFCPKCDKEMNYFDNRYICECGYKSKKIKQREINSEEYQEGMLNSGRMIK